MGKALSRSGALVSGQVVIPLVKAARGLGIDLDAAVARVGQLSLAELEEPDAVALVHNPVCGDMLRLAIQVRNGRIVDVRFKAYGCAAAIAAASVATELMKGAPVEEAGAISEEEYLGGNIRVSYNFQFFHLMLLLPLPRGSENGALHG